MKYFLYHEVSEENYNILIDEFLSYSANVKGCTNTTIKVYAFELIIFFRYLVAIKNGVKPSEISNYKIYIGIISVDDIAKLGIDDIYNFLSYCEWYRNNKAMSRSRKIATIKSFFNYYNFERRLLPSNILRDVKWPKIDKKNAKSLTLEESQRFLSAISGKHKVRDYAIACIFLYTGLRVSEVINIRLTDIKDHFLCVSGKGQTQRKIFIPNPCLEAINEYIKIRQLIYAKEAGNYLFISQKMKPISARTILSMIKRTADKAGLNADEISPHVLRHTAASLMYEGGADILSLQKILGHENVSTARIYPHPDEERIIGAMTCNPLCEGELKIKNKEDTSDADTI
ncbi:tyrosine-type recombinase/integrase [Eubacterium limosum]|uniref:tyrosine-type recombinase/integrase n=1 Tax=Eubacterium limosum TaxID=1736 RepID=UPI0037241C63